MQLGAEPPLIVDSGKDKAALTEVGVERGKRLEIALTRGEAGLDEHKVDALLTQHPSGADEHVEIGSLGVDLQDLHVLDAVNIAEMIHGVDGDVLRVGVSGTGSVAQAVTFGPPLEGDAERASGGTERERVNVGGRT
jgi:hypothetical protein